MKQKVGLCTAKLKLSDFKFKSNFWHQWFWMSNVKKKNTLWYQAVWYNQHFSPFCIQSRTYFSKINRFCVEYSRNSKLSRLEIQVICISILFSYIFIGKLRTNLGSLLVVLSKHFSLAVCRKALGDFIYTLSIICF